MKYQNLLPSLVVFAVFLLTGVWIGRWFANSIEADQFSSAGNRLPSLTALHQSDPSSGLTGEHSNAPLPIQASPNRENEPRQKQNNVLLIGVNDLDESQPTLESIWLILYLPDMPQVTWMPVYPQVVRTQDGVHIQAKAELVETFAIENGDAPAKDFLKILEQEGIWWSHLVIADRTAVIELLDSVGGIEIISSNNPLEGQKISGVEAFSTIQPAKNDLQGALFSQANLIQQICRIPPKSYLNLNMAKRLLTILNDHLITDITAEHMIDDLQLMLSSGAGFVCDFPSLSLYSSLK